MMTENHAPDETLSPVRKRMTFRRFCLIAGIVLLSLAVLLLVFWQWTLHRDAERLSYYVESIYARMPQIESAVPEKRANNAMPSLVIDDESFSAVLTFPRQRAEFPLGSSFRAHGGYPCRYTGSVYDNSLVIRGTNRPGQLDFIRELSVGDRIFVTDMTGARYTYTVSDILYVRSVDADFSADGLSDLTLLVDNVYAFETIQFRCRFGGNG